MSRIIVGVKYCFRYNQRNRALRAGAEGDPIDLATMPRPHRRRREKKLMSMEDVNQRFPLIKYKTWRTTREKEGLPAAGGITSPTSRPASIKEFVDDSARSIRGASHETPRPESSLSHPNLPSPPQSPSRSAHQPDRIAEASTGEEKQGTEKPKDTSENAVLSKEIAPAVGASADEEEEDDDPIRNATSPAMLATPGDTCAICLDVLEEEDDVRGLTCGHAFHAACIDPWLTGRRACCPLCKADYYVPKPRSEGEQAADGHHTGRRSAGMTALRLNLPQSPQNTWLGGRYISSRNRMVVTGHQHDAQSTRRSRHRGSAPTTTTTTTTTTSPEIRPDQVPGWRGRLRGFTPSRPSLPTLSNPFRRNRQDAAATTTAEPSPAQLEAGTAR